MSHEEYTAISASPVHKFSGLVCPVSKGNLLISDNHEWLYSVSANLAYPIKNNIPVMLPSEARPLTDDERAVLKSKIKT